MAHGAAVGQSGVGEAQGAGAVLFSIHQLHPLRNRQAEVSGGCGGQVKARGKEHFLAAGGVQGGGAALRVQLRHRVLQQGAVRPHARGPR